MNIRTVSLSDTRDLLAIYTPYVLHTAITFEYVVPSHEEFESRIRTISANYPYLIAEENGKILGYAYASAFRTRAAYAWSVETSIYVKEGSHGKGIGKALYLALEQYLTKQNVCSLYAGISYPNPQSIAFHESSGYKKVAHFTRSGYKFEAWHDLIWMEKFINEHTIPPRPFIPFSQLQPLY